MFDMLKYYTREVSKLRNAGKKLHLTEEDINRIIDESFQFLEEHSPKKTRNQRSPKSRHVLRNLICLTVFLWTVYVIYTYRKVIHSYVEWNVQEITYPGMKLVRKAMLPVVRAFPSLTEWYDEACLVGNPYFQVPDIDCWPCEGVRSVLNLTTSNFQSDQHHSGIPFIARDDQLNEVTFDKLQLVYAKNRVIFDKDAPRITESQFQVKTAEHLFITHRSNLENTTHIVWKLNRLEPTRLIRSLFGVVRRVPKYVSGATPEKFVLIDGAQAGPYEIPPTEGSTVFLVQGSGSRIIILNPSPECSSSCHRVSIDLQPHHVLWYNWWYWRGFSVPINQSSDISITYVGSYY